MLTEAERQFLHQNLSVSRFDQVIQSVELYCSIRTLMIGGISTVNERPAIARENAERIDVNGEESPLTLHGPRWYSPQRAGKAVVFHHETAGQNGQNIGDISYSPKNHTFTLNLLFGWVPDDSERTPPHGWTSYVEQDTRIKIVLKDIANSTDLSVLRDGLQAWRKRWRLLSLA